MKTAFELQSFSGFEKRYNAVVGSGAIEVAVAEISSRWYLVL